MSKPTSIAPSQIVRPALSVPVHSFLIHNCDVNIRSGQIQLAKIRQMVPSNADERAQLDKGIQDLTDMIANFERAKKELGRGKR